MCLQVTRQSVSLLAKNWQYCLLTNLLILKFNKKENVSKKNDIGTDSQSSCHVR